MHDRIDYERYSAAPARASHVLRRQRLTISVSPCPASYSMAFRPAAEGTAKIFLPHVSTRLRTCRSFYTSQNLRKYLQQTTERVVGKPEAVPASQKPPAESSTTGAQPTDENILAGMMFPWERAVLSSPRKEKLGTAGKIYWGLFAASVFLLVGNRAREHYNEINKPPPDPVIEKRRKERMKASVQGAMEGGSFIKYNSGDEDDPFEGLTPAEIEALVQKEAGPSNDPFEGMTPDEINRYMENQLKDNPLQRRGL